MFLGCGAKQKWTTTKNIYLSNNNCLALCACIARQIWARFGDTRSVVGVNNFAPNRNKLCRHKRGRLIRPDTRHTYRPIAASKFTANIHLFVGLSKRARARSAKVAAVLRCKSGNCQNARVRDLQICRSQCPAKRQIYKQNQKWTTRRRITLSSGAPKFFRQNFAVSAKKSHKPANKTVAHCQH